MSSGDNVVSLIERISKIKARVEVGAMTPERCRAARGIAFMTQPRLAEVADVPRNVIIDFELNSLRPKPAYLRAMRRVLEQRNVEFIDGDPPSVRLKI